MAAATRSSSVALVKAAVLPLILVLLAVAAGASNTEDGLAVAEAGGRFSETPLGRKLLAINLCLSLLPPHGSAPDYDCKKLLPLAKIPHCCPDPLNLILTCFDTTFDVLKCGSCTNKCALGQICCSGVCVNPLTDKNNCGRCDNKCNLCKLGFCKY